VQDPALDSEDVRQVALIELMHALPSYRYASRFSTWAYSVVVQRARRFLRDRTAQKRTATIVSYELRPPREVGSDTYLQPAAIVEGAMLHSMIDRILSDLYGPRMVTIFNYWARNDMGISQISKLMQISPSRVHALIHTARGALQHHPAIQAWVRDHGTAGLRHPAWADSAQP
jgi:RNA polymerase sigma factor (sigma-70 family)